MTRGIMEAGIVRTGLTGIPPIGAWAGEDGTIRGIAHGVMEDGVIMAAMAIMVITIIIIKVITDTVIPLTVIREDGQALPTVSGDGVQALVHRPLADEAPPLRRHEAPLPVKAPAFAVREEAHR